MKFKMNFIVFPSFSRNIYDDGITLILKTFNTDNWPVNSASWEGEHIDYYITAKEVNRYEKTRISDYKIYDIDKHEKMLNFTIEYRRTHKSLFQKLIIKLKSIFR